MVVFLGEGYALWRGVVGLCTGCPDGWGRGEGGMHPVLVTCPAVLPGKRVGNPCTCSETPGP
jgi:hypothetical protein